MPEIIMALLALFGFFGVFVCAWAIWQCDIRPLLFPTYEEKERKRRDREIDAYLKAIDKVNKKRG